MGGKRTNGRRLGLRAPEWHIDLEHPGSVVAERYLRGSGTSQAAAVVSGAVALLLDARPDLTPDAAKAVIEASATALPSAEARGQGNGRIDVCAAARAAVPLFHRQSFARSTGNGTIEGARGTSHVAEDGIELRGELDIMGMPWNGAAWAPKSATGTAWSGGTWNGSEWLGDCLCSVSWTGSSWTGRSWSGRSWSGTSWTGTSWTGRSWSSAPSRGA